MAETTSTLEPPFLHFPEYSKMDLQSGSYACETDSTAWGSYQILQNIDGGQAQSFGSLADQEESSTTTLPLNLVPILRRAVWLKALADSQEVLSRVQDNTDIGSYERAQRSLVRLLVYPQKIQDALQILRQESGDDTELYAATDVIVEWVEDIISENKAAPDILTVVSQLSERSIRILLASFADSELVFDNERPLAKGIEEYLFAEDARLAQSAAAFLVVCCGESGKRIIKNTIEKSPPHAGLVAGMVDLIQ